MHMSPAWLPVLLVTICLSVGAQGQEVVKPLDGKAKNDSKPTTFPCIVCDSLKDKFCEPWDHFSHSKDCLKDSRIDKTKPVGCRKMVQAIKDRSYVSRHCTNLVDDDVQGCIDRVGTNKIKVTYCHCREPTCNSGSQVSASGWALHLLPPLGMVLFALGPR